MKFTRKIMQNNIKKNDQEKHIRKEFVTVPRLFISELFLNRFTIVVQLLPNCAGTVSYLVHNCFITVNKLCQPSYKCLKIVPKLYHFYWLFEAK